MRPLIRRKHRRILDEELYGMERVKQRIIETIIQINRTHTLPAYGLLLVGPAGTGKSQIAYAVARILKAAVDNTGYEFHQRSGAADRKLPYLCQCKTRYHHGSIFHGRRVQSGIYYQRAGQGGQPAKETAIRRMYCLTLAG